MQGRAVLVTEAARGIGREVARQLAERGATVLVSARDADHARAAAEELSAGSDVRAFKVDLDVTDDASVHAAAQTLEDNPGRLDVLVNNAAAYVDWSETLTSTLAAELADTHPRECRVLRPDPHLVRCRGYGSATGHRRRRLGAMGSHAARRWTSGELRRDG